MQDRAYQRKKQLVEKFIKKHGKKVDHSFILNEVDVDYDTLMMIFSELRNQGQLK
jgi:hypothetical protein